MKNLFLVVFSLFVISPIAYAQSDRRAEVFVGYSNLQAEGLADPDDPSNLFDDDFFDRRRGLHGINAQFTGYFNSAFGIKGDFSFHRKEDSLSNLLGGSDSSENRVMYFMAGPTVKFLKGNRVEPFVHALAGGANTRFDVISTQPVAGGVSRTSFETSSTDFAIGLGGGIDLNLGERFGLRLIQVDYAPVFLRDRSINVLGSAGAIVPFTLEGQRQDSIRISVGVKF
jgi:opacity protein-like surface antigen